MSRRAALLAVVATVALLAGCGTTSGGGNASASGTTTEKSTTAAPTTPVAPFKSLCEQYCLSLRSFDSECGGVKDPNQFQMDLTTCQREAARGFDQANAVATALASEQRVPLGPVDNILDAMDSLKQAYDTYGDDSHCALLALETGAHITLTSLDRVYLATCQTEMASVSISISTVGVNLQNAAK